MTQNKTHTAKAGDIQREWHLYDLAGKILGRASTEIARLLMGKHKATYTPNIDQGDYVVVINADKVEVTGNKLSSKMYYHHSGYPGGLKQESLADKMASNPAEVIEHSVKGMLPKNKLQTPRLRRMKIYTGSEHPHSNHFEQKKLTNEETNNA